ncbi:DUF2157 domain-containing protein [Undibacterium seohonense]|uniref:DUF2157 domain-containing protein n=1 Tax=Undibacterium seohonense TaxID=1344950 RepID=A0ABR6X0G8_9BURK|nr:DUF2157 domain-containing protein [Undibacterium seohonense]MBC3806376.1 DUF2157 domain-containing protein [Undibacterium seohonense]
MEQPNKVLDWIAQGRVKVGSEVVALNLAGIQPEAAQWRRFIDQMLLWCGAIALGASLIFFLAYNWQTMGRFAKFGLAEAAVLIALMACWKLGLENIAGKASLLLASLFTGGLLALVGQTYQTGADTYELFRAWAIASLVWMMLAQLSAMYLFWLGLVNLSVLLYFQTFGGFFGLVFSSSNQLWAMLILNAIALAAWEWLRWRGVQHLQERWSARVVATVVGVLATILMLEAIFSDGDRYRQIGSSANLLAMISYLVWASLTFWVYRRKVKDLFVLAGLVLSLIITVNAWLAREVLSHSDAARFLFVGLMIIGSSALGGIWLKTMMKEMQS